MNYEDMSDFEINREVAVISGTEIGHVQSSSNKFGTVNLTNGRVFNPCNNPSDAWPIIIDNWLILEPNATKDTYFSATRNCEFNHQDANPLRAAMICFLKMKDAEKQ